ncbi:MAG: hypothetical protein KDB82_18390 [Planctomycetes bacterium]|nr:hypothetical protein [Planctomycetota bacterium]
MPTIVAAQGALSGRVVDAAGGSEYLDDAALIGAVALPEDAPPFNEITSAHWQEAFNALATGEADVTLGGLLAEVTPIASYFGEVQGDGTYRLEGLPLKTRLGVAAKIGDLWWPLREEVWLTEESPELEKQIDYFRLGADPAGVRIETYRLNVKGGIGGKLRFAQVQAYETLKIVNPDPTRGAMVHVEMRIMVPPGSAARSLPDLYGMIFSYVQCWNATAPVTAPQGEDEQAAWMLGTRAGPHAAQPTATPGAHTSADNWHWLNQDPVLAIVGAGDTEYRIDPSPGGRAATLVFDRPVPPALNGNPGRLVIHLVHLGGVLMSMPSEKLAFERTFNLDVIDAVAQITPELTLAGLVEGVHRRFYGEPENGMYPPNPEVAPDLTAGQTVQIVLGFNHDAQDRMAELEQAAMQEDAPPEKPTQDETEPATRFDWSVLFKSLAFVFGLAFIGALVATLRFPREKQLKRLAELPATRKEVLAAVVKLEQEYKEGKIPARAYTEHRQRLLNRLVELDSRG